MNPTPKVRAPAVPIETLHTDAAKFYTHIHPVLVLSLYALRFNAIVADPVPALLRTLVPLAALQIAYVAICLPPTGGSTAIVEKKKPGEKKKVAERGLSRSIIPAFLSLTVSVLIVTPLLSAILVLFGAPISTHYSHTLLAAAHISLLATLPLVYVHGVDGQTWREVVSLLLPGDEVFGGLVGTCVGAWLGAVPIPLDWDREWQKWPVTIVTGAYIGFAIGKLVGGTIGKGRKIMFE